MKRHRVLIRAAATLSAALCAYACGDGGTEPPPPDPPRPTTVTVSPATVELAAHAATVRLTAEVRDQNGQVIAGATVAWSSSDASVASVDRSGVVTAQQDGATTITATAGTASGSAAVTVARVAVSASVSPAADTLEVADTLRLFAAARDANDYALPDVAFAWTSSDRLVAVVDSSGLVTGIAAGTTMVTATAGGVRGHAEVTVVLPPTERELLEAVYLKTGGPAWRNNRNWLTDAPLAQWHGVFVDDSGHVVRLFLENNNLAGAVPVELGRLAMLTELNLAANQLTGPIPPALGNLGNLTGLSLFLNQLSGPIPPALGNLGNLTELFLFRNQLSGSIPVELGNLATLTSLSLYSNDLSGPIPPEIGNLKNLTRLSLSWNDLTDAIPPEIGNLAALEGLYLYGNSLSGPIPPEIGSLKQLRHFGLGFNSGISGPIPPELRLIS